MLEFSYISAEKMSDTGTTKSAKHAGEQAYRAGDYESAKHSYQKAIANDPGDIDSLIGLVDIELTLKNYPTAEKYMRDAIQVNRYGVGFQCKLGDILFRQKKYREAEAAYFEELRMRPDFALSHIRLGQLMLRLGNSTRAIKHLETSLQFDKGNVLALILLGKAYLDKNELVHAEAKLKSALEFDQRSDLAHGYMGLLCLRHRQYDLATSHFEKALSTNPECTIALKGQGFRLVEIGEIPKAIAKFNRVLDLNSEDVEATVALAKIWSRQGVWDAADKYYRRSHELSPHSTAILSEWAELQEFRGLLEEAINNYEKALQIKPSDHKCLSGYGRLKAKMGDTKLALPKLSTAVQSGQASAELLGTYALLLGASDRGREGITLLEQRMRTRMPEREKCKLHFTLGDLLHADSSYDLAFHHYRRANQLKKTAFDEAKFNQYCDSIISEFSPSTLASANRSTMTGENIFFLLGMPRSGVNVLQNYLSSLGGVYVRGNSPFIEMVAYRASAESGFRWPSEIDHFDVGVLDKFAQLFLSRLQLGAEQRDVLVDATWRNFLYIGVIELLFPHARIVYCARDYRDVALSCYFTNFYSPSSMSFTYDLHDIAKFINGHKRVMRHWKNVTSLPFHIVSYEEMILDFEEEAASLVQFLGLRGEREWDKATEEQKIPKPSSLKSTSLRRYRHYKNHLDGFLEILDSDPGVAF